MTEDDVNETGGGGGEEAADAREVSPAGLRKRVEDAADSGAFASASGAEAHAASGHGQRTSALMGVPVSMRAVLGTARVPVAEFLALEVGATVQLDRRVGEPVDIVVNEARVASGEIVMMDEATGQLGIRITIIGDEAEAA